VTDPDLFAQLERTYTRAVIGAAAGGLVAGFVLGLLAA
jgi:hypothetical protein